MIKTKKYYSVYKEAITLFQTFAAAIKHGGGKYDF